MNRVIRDNKKSFTLAELLIVVAIIGVLVGVSIPIFNRQMEKAREATDLANMRAAASLAVELMYMDKDEAIAAGYTWYQSSSDTNAYGIYDPTTGTIYNKYDGTVKPYGQGTAIDGGTDYKWYYNNQSYENAVINVSFYPNETVPYVQVGWRYTDANGKNPKGFVNGRENSMKIYLN